MFFIIPIIRLRIRYPPHIQLPYNVTKIAILQMILCLISLGILTNQFMTGENVVDQDDFSYVSDCTMKGWFSGSSTSTKLYQGDINVNLLVHILPYVAIFGRLFFAGFILFWLHGKKYEDIKNRKRNCYMLIVVEFILMVLPFAILPLLCIVHANSIDSFLQFYTIMGIILGIVSTIVLARLALVNVYKVDDVVSIVNHENL